MQLLGKNVVVTGAGGGIGRALVRRFLSEGANAIVAADINITGAQETAKESGCLAMAVDVSNEQDVIRLIEDAESAIGPIDLFCS